MRVPLLCPIAAIYLDRRRGRRRRASPSSLAIRSRSLLGNSVYSVIYTSRRSTIMSLSGLQLPSVQSLASMAVPFSRPQTPGIPTQFGYIGLGTMGAPMARNLCKKLQNAGPGHHDSLLVWNRTTAKSKKFVDDIGSGSARVASDVAEVARECDVVFTCLGTDEAVESIYAEMVAAIKVSATLYMRQNCLISSRMITPSTEYLST